jgi:predicted nucleic acid-binding protein
MIFFDTSVYLAASLAAHEKHQPCFAVLERAVSKRQKMACGVHSMSELYSTLTRLPLPHRLSPHDAIAIVNRIESFTKLFGVSPSEQMKIIRDCATRHLVSGIVHDAELVACARKADATAIYTLNARHFLLAAPDLAHLIHEP